MFSLIIYLMDWKVLALLGVGAFVFLNPTLAQGGASTPPSIPFTSEPPAQTENTLTPGQRAVSRRQQHILNQQNQLNPGGYSPDTSVGFKTPGGSLITYVDTIRTNTGTLHSLSLAERANVERLVNDTSATNANGSPAVGRPYYDSSTGNIGIDYSVDS